jgi:hypothetical protein
VWRKVRVGSRVRGTSAGDVLAFATNQITVAGANRDAEDLIGDDP